jgi:pimeloyl-ACP methyl ester carboxylesterase
VPTAFVEAAGTRIFVREWGRPDASPVVFWHALGDHTGLQIGEAAPLLAEHFGLRVLAPDAPGFGESHGLERIDDYAVEAIGRLATSLLDALELERAAWVGASWGASIGLEAAARSPERVAALALLDGGYQRFEPATLDEIRAGLEEREDEFRYPSWDALFEDARRYFGRLSPAMENACRSAMREENGQVVSRLGPERYAWIAYALRRYDAAAAAEAVGRAGVPVLLVAATHPPESEPDRRRAIARFREAAPQTQLHDVAAGHAVLEELGAHVADVLGPWLVAQAAE